MSVRQPQVLMVDDDPSILATTALALEAEGYRVATSEDGERALELIRSQPPDVLLLDVMLPGRDGFELCREVRRFSEIPIILLTAKTDTVDVVVGLESGADDYVAKPFDVKVLVARIRSVLRRIRERGSGEDVIRVGDLEIRPDEGLVLKAGDPLALTKTELQLVCMLASQPQRVFSREILLRDVWGYDYFGDVRLVDVHIRRLRSKVEDDPGSPRYIQTVRGLGYKLTDGR